MEYIIRTKPDWIAEARQSLPKCKWFIVEYFSEARYEKLMQLLDEGEISKLIEMLNTIWFVLPDGQFNIMVSPAGWNEFLSLIEFWNTEEQEQICE